MPRLFATKDRDEAHAKLKEVIASGKHSLAECREYHNEDEPYQVWTEPVEWVQTPPSPAPAAEPDISDALLDRLAQKLLEKMSEKK